MASLTMESLLNCPVCLEPFQNPKALRCLHTFCLPCLEQICGQERAITCPTCREKTLVPMGGLWALRTDFKVAQMHDTIRELKIASAQVKCEVCREGKGKAKCLHCRRVFCGGCLAKHGARADAGQHTVLELSGVVKCVAHDTDCTHVCADCRNLVCLDCTYHKCEGHSCTELGQAVRQVLSKGTLRDARSGSLMDQLGEAKTKQQQAFEDMDSEIQHHADLVVNAIKTERQRLREAVQQMRTETMDGLELSRLEEEDRLQSLVSLADLSLEGVKQGIPARLLRDLPGIMGVGKPANAHDAGQVPYKILEVAFDATLDLDEFTLGAVSMKSSAEHANTRRPRKPCPNVRFEKIVLDGRCRCKILMGLLDDIIVCNDLNSPNTPVGVYRRGTDAGYEGLAEIMSTFKPIFVTDGWRDLLPDIQPMSKALLRYAEENDIKLTFIPAPRKRPVSQDRRPANQERKGQQTAPKVPPLMTTPKKHQGNAGKNKRPPSGKHKENKN